MKMEMIEKINYFRTAQVTQCIIYTYKEKLELRWIGWKWRWKWGERE